MDGWWREDTGVLYEARGRSLQSWKRPELRATTTGCSLPSVLVFSKLAPALGQRAGSSWVPHWVLGTPAGRLPRLTAGFMLKG